MKTYRMRFSLFLSALVFAPCVLAQGSYPSRPVRLIVPYPPGGSTDFVAREVAHKLSETWGQQMVRVPFVLVGRWSAVIKNAGITVDAPR